MIQRGYEIRHKRPERDSQKQLFTQIWQRLDESSKEFNERAKRRAAAVSGTVERMLFREYRG